MKEGSSCTKDVDFAWRAGDKRPELVHKCKMLTVWGYTDTIRFSSITSQEVSGDSVAVERNVVNAEGGKAVGDVISDHFVVELGVAGIDVGNNSEFTVIQNNAVSLPGVESKEDRLDYQFLARIGSESFVV